MKPKNSSIGTHLTLDKATAIAQEWIENLSPYCLRIESAGTVRRADEETTHDIDLVIIRDEDKIEDFTRVLNELEYVKGKPDGKWLMRKLDDGTVLDIRMCTEDDFGWHLFQATGPTDFYLFAQTELEDCDKDFPEEKDVFAALGIDYIIPRNRFCEAGWRTNQENKNMNKAKNWLQKLIDKKVIGEVIHNVSFNKATKRKVGNLSIRGFIGSSFFSGGVTDKSVADALRDIGKVDDLKVVINSVGGDVFIAFSIFSQLRKFAANIIIEIEGLAASAAAFISQAGDKRIMSKNALFMIHKASGCGCGNEEDIEKLRNTLGKIDGILESTFVDASTSTVESIREFMKAEEFMTANQALDRGFIDEIGDESDVDPHVAEGESEASNEIIEQIYERVAKEAKDDIVFKSLEKLVADFGDTSKSNKEAEMAEKKRFTEIMNVLNVQDENKILEAIKALQEDHSTVTALNTVVDDSGIEGRLALVEKNVTALEKTNKSLIDQRDLAVKNMGEVMEFKNSSLLDVRRTEIESFFMKGKINPAQRDDAIKTFVDIDPDNFEDTEPLYAASMAVWSLNTVDKSLEKLNGSLESGDEGVDNQDKNADEIDKLVIEYQNEKKCSYDDAYAAVENAHPELFEAPKVKATAA